jgi:hypothetical protein
MAFERADFVNVRGMHSGWLQRLVTSLVCIWFTKQPRGLSCLLCLIDELRKVLTEPMRA